MVMHRRNQWSLLELAIDFPEEATWDFCRFCELEVQKFQHGWPTGQLAQVFKSKPNPE